jgi:hypothetical protein
MFTVSMSHGALKALALIAPQEEARTCLNTICVDTTTAGRVHLVACDGHRMLIVGNATAEGDIPAGQFLIPASACRGVKQRGTERYPLPITIDITPTVAGRGEFTIFGKSDVVGQLQDDRYPQWQRVTPREVSGKLAHFNLGYLAEFHKAAMYMGKEFPVIQHNGDGAALIDMGPDAFGVLMPIRQPRGIVGGLPAWFDPPADAQKVAA